MGGLVVDKTKIMQSHLQTEVWVEGWSHYLSGLVGGWVVGKTKLMLYSTQVVVEVEVWVELGNKIKLL